MKSDDLAAIIDFLYYGEAKVCQEDFDSFLNLAEELGLKGLGKEDLVGGTKLSEKNPPNQENIQNQTKTASQINVIVPESYSNSQQLDSEMIKEEFAENFTDHQQPIYENKVILPNQDVNIYDMKDLDDKINTMIGLGENLMKNGSRMTKVYVCKVCGKEGGSTNIKNHIEANHLEGMFIPCILCVKKFRSRSALKQHNYNHHAHNN